MRTIRISVASFLFLGVLAFQSCTLNDPASVPEHAVTKMSSSLDYGFSSQSVLYSVPLEYSSAYVPLSSVEIYHSSMESPLSSMEFASSSTIEFSSAALPSSSAVIASSASIGTGGLLQVTFQPITNNGEYCPSNVNATWITTGTGTWVQNLEVRAKVRVSKLAKWRTDYTRAVVQGVDGVAGATQGSFQAKNLSWDITGKAQGNYTLKLEYSCDNFAGPFNTVNFVLNGARIDTTVSFTYFKNVHLYYVP